MSITDNKFSKLLKFIGIKKSWFYGLLLTVAFLESHAQDWHKSKEISFVSHLINEQNYLAASQASLALLQQPLNKPQHDSLTYFNGIAHFRMDSFNQALSSFKLVTDGVVYFPSKFYEALSYGKMFQYTDAFQTMQHITNIPSEMGRFKHYVTASYALLNRDFKSFDSISHQFDLHDYRWDKELQQLVSIRAALKKEKRKSPFLAGLYSAVVPGLGKWYAGNLNQGISAFIPTVIYGICTYESYKRMGGFASKPDLRIVPFVSFSAAFSVFYLGNIIGSAKSVKTKYYRNQTKRNEEILEGLTHTHRLVLQ